MLDRDVPQRLGGANPPSPARRREHGELRDHDPAAGRGRERDPGPRGLEPLGCDAMVGEGSDDRVGQRPSGQEPERRREQGDEQRLAGDQPPDLTGRGAERAQHGVLAPALGDREGERPGDDEERHEAGDPAHDAEDRDQRGAIAGRVTGVRVGGVIAAEDLDGRAETRLELLGGHAGRGEDADRADVIRRARQPRRGVRGEEQDAPAPGTGHEAADAVRAFTAGRGDPHGLSGTDAEPHVGDDVPRPLRRAAGPQAVRRERGARPAMPVGTAQGAAARVDDARVERDVTDRPLDARDRRDTLHRRDVQQRRGHHGHGLGIVARAERDRGRRAHHGVGGSETAGPRGAEGAGQQRSGRVRQHDGEQERDERAGQRRAPGPQGLPGDEQHGSVPEVGQAFGHLLGGRRVERPGEAAVAHEHDAIGPRGGGRVVGDHDERARALVDGATQQREHTSPGPGVERTGGLVGEDHVGLPDERPGDRDPLLLTARELCGTVLDPVPQPDAFERRPDRGARNAPAGEPRRQRDVLLRGERTEQVEGLEHEADALAPEPGERVLRQPVERLVAEPHAAGGGAIKSRGQLQQRRLAGARRSHDRRERATVERQRHAVQGAHRAFPTTEHADEVFEFDHAGAGSGLQEHADSVPIRDPDHRRGSPRRTLTCASLARGIAVRPYVR